MVSARKFHFANLHYRLVLPIVLVLLCAFSNPIFSQYNLQWNQFFGGNNFDELLSVIEVEDGLVYGGSAGAFSGTMGDAPQTNGNSDYWIYKTDYDGNIIWSYVYGGVDQEPLESSDLSPLVFENEKPTAINPPSWVLIKDVRVS